MADRIVQSHHDCGGRSGQSMHSNQSVWMAHWTQTSCNARPQLHNHNSRPFGNREDNRDTKQHHLLSGAEIASNFSRSDKGFREARTFGVMNESLRTSSKNLRRERLGFQPFLTDQGTSYMQALRPQIDHNLEYSTTAHCTNGNHCPSVLAMAPTATEASSRECHFQPEGISQNQDDFTGSASHIVPYRFDHGEYRFDSRRTASPSFMCRQEEINQLSSILASKEHLSNTNLTFLEHERCNYHSHSAFFVSDKKLNNHSNGGKSVIPYLRQNDASLFPNDPSTSNNRSPVFAGEQYQRMQNRSSIRLFPTQSCPPEMTEPEKLHHGCYSLQRMPHSAHDMETMRICTTMDSVEGLPGGPPRFSQTTHSLLITKKTDVNLCKENQVFRESRVSAQVKGNTLGELHSLSPLFGHGQHGVKLQPLGGSSDSEGKENVEDVKVSDVVLKSESSAETDTMDMDTFMEKIYLSGVNSSPSNKEIMVDPNLPPQATIASARGEVGCRRPKIDLPDINLELPALPAAANSIDNAEPSTSRTQSLDMELLIAHAEQPSNSESNLCPDGALKPEPSSRWVKRLKLSASDTFALGTKSSNLGEASSHEKVSKFFSKIMKGSTTGSETTLNKHHGKELMALDQTTALLRNGVSSSVDMAKKGQEVTLSHSWIQRWRHSQAATPQKKPEAVVVCEPQSSKVALEDLQKKQFPSLAAMALMGKAMHGFQPCEFRKRGSFVVWNTKGF